MKNMITFFQGGGHGHESHGHHGHHGHHENSGDDDIEEADVEIIDPKQ